jgi:hypothetical protein
VTEPLPFTDAVSTVEATDSPDDPVYLCFGETHTVWHAYTPSVDQSVNVSTFGSDFDTTLTVVTGEPGNFEFVTCGDNSGDGLQSSVTWLATAGTTYFILSGSCCWGGGSGGNLALTVQEGGPPAAVAVTIDPVGHVNTRTGVAVISGTNTCTGAYGVDVSGGVTQRVGRLFTISGDFYVSAEPCDGTARPWTAEVAPYSGKFAGGPATVRLYASGCGDFNCAEAQAEGRITLRR